MVEDRGQGLCRQRNAALVRVQASDDASTTIIELDHIKKTYHIDKLSALESADGDGGASGGYDDNDNEQLDVYAPNESAMQKKLCSPNIVTFLDIDKIEFERNRSGILGWRTEKTDRINGYDCKVYTANNLQLVTKTRVEHLNSEQAKEFLGDLENEEESSESKRSNANLPGFLSSFFQGSHQHIKAC